MMRFEFATASRILFGRGVSREIPSLVETEGKRPFVLTGADPSRAKELLDDLTRRGLQVQTHPIAEEPTTDTVWDAVARARRHQTDVVIGIGGGSPVDAGKAVAAMLTNPGELMDYLEVIGRGRAIAVSPAPYIAVPTTAGTGAEVTRNAVIGAKEKKVKVSMRSPLMLPSLAVVDPELTRTMPRETTADSGLDALTQLIEPFVSNRANPLTDSLCREGMTRAARSLRRAHRDGDDMEAREEMSLAGLFGGLALANAKLGAVHGFAGPIGGMFDAPHGAICAKLLTPVLETNVRALEERAPDSPSLTKLHQVGVLLTGDPGAKAADGARWIAHLCDDLSLRPLCTYGITEADVPAIVEKSKNASSMKGNPLPLTDRELADILHSALT